MDELLTPNVFAIETATAVVKFLLSTESGSSIRGIKAEIEGGKTKLLVPVIRGGVIEPEEQKIKTSDESSTEEKLPDEEGYEIICELSCKEQEKDEGADTRSKNKRKRLLIRG